MSKAYKDGRRTYTFNESSAWSRGRTRFTDERIRTTWTAEEIFSEHSPLSQTALRQYVREMNLIPYRCYRCGNEGTWNAASLTLELDHVNGNNRDNRLDNLRYACPNCHSQTPTFRRKNKPDGRVSDEVLVAALIKHNGVISRALREVGLAAKGGNHYRARELRAKHGIVRM